MVGFSQAIYKIGINPVVDPPDDVLASVFEQAGKSKGPIPVCGKLNGAEFIQTLVKYQGAWRLYINGEMLKASGLKVGDTAKVEIEYDPRPRDVPVPRQFSRALEKDKSARSAYAELSPSRQKEILRYLDSLKSADSLNKNIERIMRHLRGEKTDAQHALMRRTKEID